MHILLGLVTTFLPLISGQEDIVISQRSGFVATCCYNETALKVVHKGSNKIQIIACLPPQPYCDYDSKMCVEQPPQESFFCEVDGIYPHINDCYGSYYCNNGQLIDSPCPMNTIFDFNRKSCRPLGSLEKFYTSMICPRPDCKGKNGVYVSHPVDKRLYVLCVKGSANSMHVCPPGKLYNAHSIPPCQFNCMGLGDYPDYEDPQKYYRCLWNGSQLTSIPSYCPEGMLFKYQGNKTFRCASSDSSTFNITTHESNSINIDDDSPE